MGKPRLAMSGGWSAYAGLNMHASKRSWHLPTALRRVGLSIAARALSAAHVTLNLTIAKHARALAVARALYAARYASSPIHRTPRYGRERFWLLNALIPAGSCAFPPPLAVWPS